MKRESRAGPGSGGPVDGLGWALQGRAPTVRTPGVNWWQRAWACSCPPSARETGLSIIITTALPPKVRDVRAAGCAGESRRFAPWAARCTRALPGPRPPATPGKGGRKGDLPREVPGVTENCLSQKQSSPPTPAFNVTFFLLLLLLWQSAEWRLESSTPSHPLWNWVAGIFFFFAV